VSVWDALLGGYSGRPDGAVPAPPQWAALYLYGLFRARLGAFLNGLGVDARITSGYRDPGKNEDVGGAANSAHLHGVAADVVILGGPLSPQDVAAAWREQTGGYALVEIDHVHLNLPRAWGWDVLRVGFAVLVLLFVVSILIFKPEVVGYGKKKKRGGRAVKA
jgi:hypothetical protein